MQKRELIGCIADDFTGAGDVCSFLVEAGAKCVLVNGIPEEIKADDMDAVVVALKIRTIEVEEAIEQVAKALDVFDKSGVTKIYYKYCSTFDSTSEGNIGPILDYIIDRYDLSYTLASPALPDNNREVFNGYLFADKVLLEHGSMANHPLTPMDDSRVSVLLERQSKYKAYNLNHRIISKKMINEFVESIDDERFYIIPDYYEGLNVEDIIKSFGDLKVLSGGSVFIRDWYTYLFESNNDIDLNDRESIDGKTLVLSGSLSNQTKAQIEAFKDANTNNFEIKADKLSDDAINNFKDLIKNGSDDLFLYSTRDKDLNQETISKNAEKLENFFADMALYAYENGVKKIIVAGGETSGAVVKILPIKAYQATAAVSPGVPVLKSTEDEEFSIVLKSGNFGDDDFFEKAINIMSGK